MAFINKLAEALGVRDDGDLGYYGEWMMSREEAQAKYDERLEDDVVDKIKEISDFYNNNKSKSNDIKKVILEKGVDCHEEYQQMEVICIQKYGLMQTFKVGEIIKLDFYQENVEKQVLVIDEDSNYYYCKEV